MLRVINVLENERSARDLIQRLKDANNHNNVEVLGNLAMSEIDDAIEVLVAGGLHRTAQKEFKKARKNVRQAIDAGTDAQKITEANMALGFLTTAKADIINP
jgi:uncharacterized protein HemY